MEALISLLPMAGRFVLASALLMVLYWIMWRKQATYRAKRAYLLTLPFMALAIAWIQVEVYKPEPIVIDIEQTVQTSSSVIECPITVPTSEGLTNEAEALVTDMAPLSEATPKDERFSTQNLLVGAYLLIIIGLFIPFGVNLALMHRLRKRTTGTKDEITCIETRTGADVKAPFSFHRSIFLPLNLTDAQRRMILAHERSHILHRHYADVWMAEVVTHLLWWNPILWWARAELRNVHEFEADSDVLAKGEDVYAYQAILIEEVLHGDIVIANGFNHSFIRRRFIEMLKTSNRRMSAWGKAGSTAWILAIAALMCCTVGEAETIYRTITVDAPESVVAEIPSVNAEVADGVKPTEEAILADEEILFEETITTDDNLSLEETILTTPEDTIKQDQAPIQKLIEGQSPLIKMLLTTLIANIEELTPEQYEELLETTVDSLPSLEEINQSIKEIKQGANEVNQDSLNEVYQQELLSIIGSGFNNNAQINFKNPHVNWTDKQGNTIKAIVNPSLHKLRQAKEDEFIIEGFVAENIADSCYNIYVGDEYLQIQDEPVATVPVVNKRFTYVMKLDKMTSGRVRCIFPGGKLCDAYIGLYFVPGETVRLYVYNGYYNIIKSDTYTEKVNQGIEDIREETKWKTPHLPKVKGKAWKEVRHRKSNGLIVKEVIFNDDETVLRIACEGYSEGMTISDDAFIMDEEGNKYYLTRAIGANIDKNNNPAIRVFGGYFAFEPMPKDTRRLTFEDHGITIKNIRKVK